MPSGVANEWMQGIQLGSNIMGSRLDRDARMQELKSRDAAQRAEEARAAKLLDLKMQEYNMQVQKAADVEKATVKFNWLRSPLIPTSSGMWVPNPHKMSTADAGMASFMPLADTPEKAAQIAGQWSMVAVRENKSANPFTPKIVDVDDGEGNKIKFGFSSPNSGQFLNTGEPTVTETPHGSFYKGSPTQPWKRFPEEVGPRQQNMKFLDLAIQHGRADLIEFDESGKASVPSKNWETLTNIAKVPPGNRAKMEMELNDMDKAFEAGVVLAPLLTPKNTGIHGAFNRVITEGFMPMIFPGSKIDPKGATAAASASQDFQARLVRGLKSDGNIAEKEVERIMSGLPNAADWKRSAPQAIINLADKLKVVGTTSRLNAFKLGKPVTKNWMLPHEIIQMSEEGRLKPQEADEALKRNGWVLIDRLREQSGIPE